MAEYLQDLITYFGIDTFGDTLTVSQAIGTILIAYIGILLTLAGIRCIFELIKIVTDWSNFR